MVVTTLLQGCFFYMGCQGGIHEGRGITKLFYKTVQITAVSDYCKTRNVSGIQT
jgi:hypothetical protein